MAQIFIAAPTTATTTVPPPTPESEAVTSSLAPISATTTTPAEQGTSLTMENMMKEIEALELQSLLVVGQIILTSALSRNESRGAHCREDYTERDDENFLKHTMAYYSPAGIDIQYRPVTITMFEPKERKY